jgi:hypothetical protein
MYEEEDDDLPLRFQGMGRHLQTNSEEFNRRLTAYLTNQAAMRDTNALFAQQFPGVPQYAHNQQALYNNMLNTQQYQQSLMQQQQQAIQQQQMSPVSPGSNYRQAPYIIPTMQNNQQSSYYPSTSHGRSASIATPQASMSSANSPLSPAIKNEEDRRLSLASAFPSSSKTSTPQVAPALVKKEPEQVKEEQMPYQQYQALLTGPFTNRNNNLFTTQLPNESQQLLGSTLDPRDPMSNMWIPYENMNSMYDFNANPMSTNSTTIGKDANFANLGGLNSTLAPSDSTFSHGNQDFNPYGETSFFEDGMKNSGHGSATGTPGGTGDFNLFIEQDQWEPTSSQ